MRCVICGGPVYRATSGLYWHNRLAGVEWSHEARPHGVAWAMAQPAFHG